MKSTSMIEKQRGLTMLSWLVVLGIAVFFILIGIKMVPTYMENHALQQVLTAMTNDIKVRQMSPAEMKKNFLKRLQINSVYEFDKKAITIKKEKFGTRFSVDYEVRKPVGGNVFIVMTFANSTLFPPP